MWASVGVSALAALHYRLLPRLGSYVCSVGEHE